MFRSIEDLPTLLRDELPREACELYVAAYNRLYQKAAANGARDEAEVRTTAHDGAILAVTTEFDVDDSGQWQRAPIGETMDHLGPADPDRPEGEGRSN